MKLFMMMLMLMLQGIIPCYMGLGANPMAGQMQTNAAQAGQVAGGYGSSASQEGGTLNPFFSNEMKATHGFTPEQTNEMLTAAEAGGGGATGATGGMLNANAARTGNATGVGKSLDEMARDRSKAAAGSSEGIAAQDVTQAKKENQEGAAGMQGLYGTNVGAQLGAMKQQSTDTMDAASLNPGWMKGVEGLVSAAGQGAAGAGSMMTGMAA
jgi:hypothetical protein